MHSNSRYFVSFLLLLATVACHNKPTEKQNVTATCGPRALSGVIRYYRLQVTWDSLAMVAGTTEKGTSMLGLANAAK